jgi:hypothetical protein
METVEQDVAYLADGVCEVCPALKLPAGKFDVRPRPGRDSLYRPGYGYRRDIGSTVGVCVHPFRVGLPPGDYASAGTPLPDREALQPDAAQLELPEDAVDLEAWFVAVLRSSNAAARAVEQAEATASERFSDEQVIAALRRALSVELSRR